MDTTFPFRMFVYGAPGSGKTSFIQSLLASSNEVHSFQFDRCTYVTNGQAISEELLKSAPNIKQMTYDQWNALSFDRLKEKYKEDGYHRVLVCDDMPMDNAILRKILEWMKNGRPHGLTVICSSQSYRGEGIRDIRSQCTYYTAMSGTTSKEWQVLTNQNISFPECDYVMTNLGSRDDNNENCVYVCTDNDNVDDDM